MMNSDNVWSRECGVALNINIHLGHTRHRLSMSNRKYSGIRKHECSPLTSIVAPMLTLLDQGFAFNENLAY